MRPQVGQVINNKYRLLRLIGDGGMGSVYEARHEVLGTSVALKFLHVELSKRPGLVQRFLQEARVSAQIHSPHVVRVTDVDQMDSGAFIVMEYIEGKTLQNLYEDLYKAGVQLSYGDALEYSMQMLEGVEAAHRSGIVHRDLKPDNVMITVDAKGRPLIKLLDFGIAKLRVTGEIERALTKPGVIMGTPEYMAPEQAFSADAVDARADIFSLGVIIFEMLAGRRPVGGDEPHQIAGAYLTGQISRLTELAPDIAPELADAVHRAMAASAGERWPAVSDLRDAMEPFAVAARAPSVMSSTSLSRLSISGLTPAASLAKLVAAVDGSSAAAAPASLGMPRPPAPAEAAGQRAVPKTLPPEDGPAASAHPPVDKDTNPADPPAMSDPIGDAAQPRPITRGPTPMGGFGAFAEAAGHAGASGPAAAPGDELAPPFVPPTRSAAPISAPRVDGASTALASPLSAGPPGLDPHALGVDYYPASPFPSGTVLHSDLSSSALGSAAPLSMAQNPLPYLGDARERPPTYLPPVVPSKASGQRKRGVLSSLPAILLLATGVSGAVVGGVYLAHRQSKADDHEDPPVATVPSATVRADPPPLPDVPIPTVVPTVSHPWHPTGPLKPPPKGSGTPMVPTAPSTKPTPSPFPPILIIPSSLPFDLPFGPPPSRPRGEPPPDPPRNRPPPPPPRGEPMGER